VRLANEGGFKPSDAGALALSSYRTVKGYDADVGNLRVSGTAVELDLLLASKDTLQAAVDSLEAHVGRVLTVRELDTPPAKVDPAQAVREGVKLFNAERYWESHEALESAWRVASGGEKEVLQGVILAAAALVHLQKNRTMVALSVMRRANEKLIGHEGEYFGINISHLREEIAKMIAEGQVDFFKIQARLPSSRAAA